jgi:hypothetical protein
MGNMVMCILCGENVFGLEVLLVEGLPFRDIEQGIIGLV